MKLTDWFGALFELFWVGIWAFTIVSMVALKDLWIEIFTAKPEIGGILTWAILLIFAIQSLRFVGFDNLSKTINRWWEAWKEAKP